MTDTDKAKALEAFEAWAKAGSFDTGDHSFKLRCWYDVIKEALSLPSIDGARDEGLDAAVKWANNRIASLEKRYAKIDNVTIKEAIALKALLAAILSKGAK